MGAPKQKWTSEEEAALKAGVIKHGAGKWRTILKDPEFSGVLYLRSNVDLKDKWRNMSVMANGWGSREKSRLAVKRIVSLPKHEENPLSITTTMQSDEEIADPKPIFSIGSALQIAAAPRRPNVRLDNLIMEAITTLKEPGGSNKTTIHAYIEEQYHAPPDFKRLLSSKLKYLTTCGKLTKVKRKYRIPLTTLSHDRRRNLKTFTGRKRISSVTSPRTDRDEVNILTRSQIDLELARMKSMDVQEATAVAERASDMIWFLIAEAEEAAMEADAAEADAEAAQAFVEEAFKTLKGRNTSKVMIRA
ncbi:PREDICTED: telomere repeat-binding factor 1-like [Tarenaya hassleriana]|uniref:telomere repeat-binding factor 1-like n=1 Tax=Tarenaya hassleriana TaxID=28532 RepID=UPI00053C9CFA|nr:PREDICTED: telomere repeat-binding factor 1-like [Tarenaya hassleriana]